MNIFVWNCLKSQRKKSFFLSFFSLLRYPLTVFLLPLPKVGCPIFLEIQNPWGKVLERSGLRYEYFCLKLSKIAAQKKVFFSHCFTFEVPFNGLFASTFQSPMSNSFRDSESLGKSNGKKSNIWTFLFGSGLKSPIKKKFFLLLILPWSTLLWHRCYYPHRSRDA